MPFVSCFFLGISWQFFPASSILLSDIKFVGYWPNRTSRENSCNQEKVRFPTTFLTFYVSFSHKLPFFYIGKPPTLYMVLSEVGIQLPVMPKYNRLRGFYPSLGILKFGEQWESNPQSKFQSVSKLQIGNTRCFYL